MVLMRKEIFEQPEVLERCLAENQDRITQIAALMKKRNTEFILLAARGTSDNASVYGKYMFETLTGLPVVLAAPSVFTIYKKKLNLKNALVIGVSQSGRGGDVLEIIRNAKLAGALTVAVTNAPDSPLDSQAEHHLYCCAGPEKSVAATKTFTAQLCLLGYLAAAVSGDREVLQSFKGVPGFVGDVLSHAAEIEAAAARYPFMEDCFVLARGFNYPIALETALKVQETCYVRAKAFATSDFYHGPMAMIERNMPVLIYAPSGPAFADTLNMIDKLRQAQADLLIISDDENICKTGDAYILVPKTGAEYVCAFCNAVVAQLFACKLSELKGLNPDTPRMLHKVTTTF